MSTFTPSAVMRLHDTARDAVVPFEVGELVTMYTCGITPYDATHLGHAATFLAYDVLQRRLRDIGHETRCVRNITDVDDSILGKARELGVHYLDLGSREVTRLQDDLAALNVLPCWSEPRATSAIADIRGFIGMVLDRGFAYQAGGGVYFDVSKASGFGSVSHYDEARMLEYARERGGNVDDPNKRNPLDFPTSQRGRPPGARAARAGTSSVRRSRSENSAPPSICMAAGAI
jgi:L-cysteine:1D-myo-inositol 2-amino-2-deoxy-alpha-D-glucopyranoside ligase